MSHIYILKDPSTLEVRYVGKTVQKPKHRLRKHIHFSKQGALTHVAAWIRGLLSRNLEPLIEVIDFREDWEDAEKYWIAEYRRRGARLTNLTIGGETGAAMKGVPRSAETKAKISAANKGQSISPEHRRKISDALKGKPRSAKVRAKISATQKGKPKWTIEQRAKIAEKALCYKPSEEARRKASETLRGRPKPPRSKEHSARISAKALGRFVSEETKALLKIQRNSPEYRAILSQRATKQWADGVHSRKLSADHKAKIGEAGRRARALKKGDAIS